MHTEKEVGGREVETVSVAPSFRARSSEPGRKAPAGRANTGLVVVFVDSPACRGWNTSKWNLEGASPARASASGTDRGSWTGGGDPPWAGERQVYQGHR